MTRSAVSRHKFRIGLKGKITLFLALLLAFVVVLLSMLVLAGIREDQQRRMEQNFAQLANSANLRVREEYLTGERVSPDEFMERNGQSLAVDLGGQSGIAVTLYSAAGEFAGTSLPVQPLTDVKEALAHTANGQAAYITLGNQVLYLAPLYNADQFLGSVQFHGSLQEQKMFYRHIRDLFIGTGAAVLAVGLLLGYLYVWRQVFILGKLNQAAREIGQGRYLDKPPIRRRDEIGELSEGIYDMSGSISSYVNELNEEKQKLLTAIQRLQELEQQQKQFIGNISHELKTPLTSILAYSDLLGMYSDDPVLLQNARIQISKEAERLYALIEKALQLSSMDIYDFETNAALFEVKPLLKEALGRLHIKAEKRGISLSSDLIDDQVWADQENLMHMVTNLLDNAVKYNRSGGWVRLSNRSETDATGERRVVIEVADNGIGIPEELQSQIFDPFFTVSDDRSRETGGTGLGLALVKSLAEKQHGSIKLAESGSDGSRFVISLPGDPVGN
ncbi:HAMP domain-containing sensor histidine kinase [Paenibacillus lupini]|uniref:HAMP domain-containing sensor histidine kinase n=1 Tax=Paenibacillus lupini TaxID=1450204 RepID=UPI001420B1D0|nr:HAMP domain-containing sensor histidine kinase [Paenibacillus lupini]NIK24140.1 signal transduction histidine kinase [Paenibacillus lupini]